MTNVRLDFGDGEFSANGRYLAATAQTVNWPFGGYDEAPGYAVVWDLRARSGVPVRVPTGTGARRPEAFIFTAV